MRDYNPYRSYQENLEYHKEKQEIAKNNGPGTRAYNLYYYGNDESKWPKPEVKEESK